MGEAEMRLAGWLPEMDGVMNLESSLWLYWAIIELCLSRLTVDPVRRTVLVDLPNQGT